MITDFENRYLCKGGDYRVLEWRAIAEPQSGLIYAAARDVTERRRLGKVRASRKASARERLRRTAES